MIYLAQLLCPKRHCIVATALEYADGQVPDPNANRQALEKLAHDLFTRLGCNKRCGICGSTVLKWEQGRTNFKDKFEAMRALQVGQEEQLFTRAMLDVMGISFDVKQAAKNN